MKQLILVRHGKTQPLEQGQLDFERPLHDDGLLNSSKIGKYLFDSEKFPNIILSSPAKRAIETSTLISEQLGYDSNKIHLNDELYEASVRTMLHTVNQLKSDWKCVVLVGHNPVISYFAEYVSGEEIGELATCGVVIIDFKSGWLNISQNTGKFKSYMYPDILEF